jgi:hypothetical protein
MLIGAAVVGSRVPVGRLVAVLKKLITWAIVVFIVYYLATNPHGAADFVKGVFHWLEGAGRALADFVNSL